MEKQCEPPGFGTFIPLAVVMKGGPTGNSNRFRNLFVPVGDCLGGKLDGTGSDSEHFSGFSVAYGRIDRVDGKLQFVFGFVGHGEILCGKRPNPLIFYPFYRNARPSVHPRGGGPQPPGRQKSGYCGKCAVSGKRGFPPNGWISAGFGALAKRGLVARLSGRPCSRILAIRL